MKPVDGQLCIVDKARAKQVVSTLQQSFERSLRAGDTPLTCCNEKKVHCDITSTTNTALRSTSGFYSSPGSSNGYSCGWSSEEPPGKPSPTPDTTRNDISLPCQSKAISPPGQHFIGTDRWSWSTDEFTDLDCVLRLQSYLCNPPRKIPVSSSMSADSFASTQWGDDNEYQAGIDC